MRVEKRPANCWPVPAKTSRPAKPRAALCFHGFALGNGVLLLALGAALLMPGWKSIRAPLSPGEFALYFALGVIIVAVSWLVLRRSPPKPILLCLAQASILLSLLGATVPYADTWLYDASFLGFSYDKLVHFSWGFTGGVVASSLVRRYTTDRGSAHALGVIFLVLGVGAYWEIVEYLVAQGLPENGVGGYDNNMQDMLANLFGACCSLVTPRSWGELQPPEPAHK